MGLVHEAEDGVRGLTVAIKTLTERGLGAPASRARLRREALTLAKLRHPNIVQALDAGECGLYGPYLALERIDGRSLDGLLTARRR